MLGLQNHFKEFSVRHFLESWNSKVDPGALFDWILQTEPDELPALFADYEVEVRKPFAGWSLDDLAMHVCDLALSAADQFANAPTSAVTGVWSAFSAPDAADSARLALASFAASTNSDISCELDSIVGDLLTNVMHLCQEDGFDFDRILLCATANFEAETI